MSAKYLNQFVKFVVIGLVVFSLNSSVPRTTPTEILAQAQSQGMYWPTQGWHTSTPEAQGMSAGLLGRMLDSVAQQHLNLHSLLVIRHGYIVSESYFSPYEQNTKHELYSCTKSFIATLTGIAIDQGFIGSVDQPISAFLPEETFQHLDAAKRQITLANMLTMTSGLDWQEGDPAYVAMYRSPNWVKYVMDLPMKVQPGTQFNYCTGCSHVLSAILQDATRTKTRDFAEKNLFEPLGISDLNWEIDSSGVTLGGWGLQLTPREMAKLGFLYLHDGTWDGRQIVARQWTETATQKHVDTNSDLDYGYQWWILPSLDGYAALGRYGQMILVVPRLDLIVVTTANLDNHDPIFQLVEDYVVPAAESF